MRAYLNGVLEATTPFSGTPNSGISSLFIGAGGDNGNTPAAYFNGLIDEVRRSSAAEIQTLYNAGSDTTTPSPPTGVGVQ